MTYTTKELYQECGREEVRKFLIEKGLGDVLGDFKGCEHVKSEDLEFEVIRAAKALKRTGVSNFSSTELTALLYYHSWNPEVASDFKKRINYRLREMFKDEARYKSEKYHMKVSAIQILRETTGNYAGNLYEAREYWERFVPSETDFRESKRIPVPLKNAVGFRLSEEDAFVLGAIYAGGHLTTGGKEKHPLRLRVRGNKKDVEFLSETLSVLVDSSFNVGNCYTEVERETRDGKGTYTLPSLDISSLAVGTWLCYDLGFPKHRTGNINKRFPEECLNEHNMEAFLSGFVSLKGTKHKQRDSIRLISRDIGLLEQSMAALGAIGIDSSGVYKTRVPFVEVVKSKMPVLLEVLDVKNPKLL